MANDIQTGAEVVIKRAKQGCYRFYGYEYTFTKVARVTKTRVFVQFGSGELEFNKADLSERGSDYNPRALVVDPAEHAKIRESIVAEQVRRTLEGTAIKALDVVKERFDMFHGHYHLENRTEAEIQLLVEFAAKLEALKAEQS